SGGFAPDEMALASEFCRIAQMHIEQAVAAIKLRQSAELDALTGSLNRRSIDQWLARCFQEAERDGQPLSVLFVDLDRFKAINDRHG
ncbi:GGDEF domain-containing protein, partial [Klebsiella pneumoniae]|uniref:GGDEF domain-containing protein n=1 Tax=Klebsiella pneumoniae TaxID=573 RepID=UPI001330FB71